MVFQCGKFVFLRTYLPDDLSINGTLELKDHKNFENYCPVTESGKNECDNNLGKITAGFLWLLGECYSALKNKTHDENSVNTFFLYIISWFSYQLNQIKGEKFTTINEFYTKNVKDSGKYEKFIREAYTIADLKGFMDGQNDFLNINIEELSKFYDASKLLCNMYGNIETNKHDKLPDTAKDFVNKYTKFKDSCNIEDASRNKILSALSADYDNIKEKCKHIQTIPEITTDISALISGDISSSSSIGKRLFAVLSIFGAIAFFLGISYKYSLFGFRKRFQKQQIREKIKNIKKRMNN
ncbi:hypothetical protein YYC_00065 [Plasmodium yoelii 17X]|uniref:Uncharacterized protein n=1 Tax=Plasmodium yoelii 17X TaxID=1323249 RepID=V7PUI4_PLAYE|nr:hypothetical protein YYC_00065 [Plasmodium yoelii 17X]